MENPNMGINRGIKKVGSVKPDWASGSCETRETYGFCSQMRRLLCALLKQIQEYITKGWFPVWRWRVTTARYAPHEIGASNKKGKKILHLKKRILRKWLHPDLPNIRYLLFFFLFLFFLFLLDIGVCLKPLGQTNTFKQGGESSKSPVAPVW